MQVSPPPWWYESKTCAYCFFCVCEWHVVTGGCARASTRLEGHEVLWERKIPLTVWSEMETVFCVPKYTQNGRHSLITLVYNNRDKEGDWSSTSTKKRIMSSWSVSKSFSGTSTVMNWVVTIRGTTSDTMTPSVHSHSPQTQSYLPTFCVCPSTLRMITRKEVYRWSIGIPFNLLVVYH